LSLDLLSALGRVAVAPVAKLDDDHSDHYGTAAVQPRNKAMNPYSAQLIQGLLTLQKGF
jgi:hypothetical protein